MGLRNQKVIATWGNGSDCVADLMEETLSDGGNVYNIRIYAEDSQFNDYRELACIDSDHAYELWSKLTECL